MIEARIGQPATIDGLMIGASNRSAPCPGEVTLEIHASSLNYHDLAVVRGMLIAEAGRIPLSDASGVIVEVGRGVTNVQIGDRVTSTFYADWQDGLGRQERHSIMGDHRDGYARSYANVPARCVMRAPAGYSHSEAATLPCAAVTAWRALAVNGQVKPGDTVLVQGSGGVSCFALQFAKAMGATVIATSSSDQKLEQLRAMGADFGINYRDQPDWAKTVYELTDGQGVDHIVEVGGSGTFGQSLHAVRNNGHIAVIGVLTGRSAEIPTALIMRKQARLIGLTVGSHQHQRDMIRAIEATGIRPVIDRHFDLADLAHAFRHQAAGAHVGKIIIDVNPVG
ncbi:MAG: NAD(P)-dependent alcohol dehydrogenase [Brevundimonas sp.]|nr:NAD(P)-dependent alcohol dehydrogenase [Brevundimonas sp.]